MRYASGKHAKGICARCGWAEPYRSLKELVVNKKPTNMFVCKSCFEPDHPQYAVADLNLREGIALQRPLPEVLSDEAYLVSRSDEYLTSIDDEYLIGSI